jgi:serine/threonine protein kinase
MDEVIELGKGTFGTVYKHEGFAKKLVRGSEFPSIMEVYVTMHMKHPNINRCHKAKMKLGYLGNDALLALDLCENVEYPSLSHIRDWLSGLHFLHLHTILHLDLKSEHLKVRDGRGVLIDFGVSRYTQSGVVKDEYCCVNLCYTAPEVQQDKWFIYSPKSEVWNMGIALLEVLCDVKYGSADHTDRDVYSDESHKTIFSNPKERFAFIDHTISQNNPDREELIDIIDGMLDPNPESRLSTLQILEKLQIKTKAKKRQETTSQLLQLNLYKRIRRDVKQNDNQDLAKDICGIIANWFIHREEPVSSDLFQKHEDKGKNIFDDIVRVLEKVNYKIL